MQKRSEIVFEVNRVESISTLKSCHLNFLIINSNRDDYGMPYSRKWPKHSFTDDELGLTTVNCKLYLTIR